tara:strand:+ start:3925 stop:4245 length:321 start_codon:yes stop_codon:yes gene_type:complete
MPYGTENLFSATAAGTDSGATATQAAVANKNHVVTGIYGHTDADALIRVTDGGTVIFESKVDISVEGFSFSFPGINLLCATNSAAAGVISASSADCQVNISGYTIP